MPLTEEAKNLAKIAADEITTESQPYRTPLEEPMRTRLDELFGQLEGMDEPAKGRRVNREQKIVIATIVGLLEEYGQNLRELTERVRPSSVLIRSSIEEVGSQLSEAESAALEQLKRRMVDRIPGHRRQWSEKNQREVVAVLRLLRKQRADIGAFRKQYSLQYAQTSVWEKEFATIVTQELVPDVFSQPETATMDAVDEPTPEKTMPVQMYLADTDEPDPQENTTQVFDQSNLATIHECQPTAIKTTDAIIVELRQQVAALTGIVGEMMQQNEMMMRAFTHKIEGKQRQESPTPLAQTREIPEAVSPMRVEATVSHGLGTTEVSLDVDGRRMNIRSNAPFLLFPLLNGKSPEQKEQ